MPHTLRKEIDQDRTFEIDEERLGFERYLYENEAWQVVLPNPALNRSEPLSLFFAVGKL